MIGRGRCGHWDLISPSCKQRDTEVGSLMLISIRSKCTSHLYCVHRAEICRGSHLVTSSGDCTLKIWDLKQGVCSMTLTDHNQAVWSCAFHDLGDYVISASMDKTCKLFDIHAQKCRQTLRGHVDSVNCVTFQPFSNNVATGSGDKTVSLWDIRTGHPSSPSRSTLILHQVSVIRRSTGEIVRSTTCPSIIEETTSSRPMPMELSRSLMSAP